MKEALSQENIEFAYVDISSSIFALKKFMQIRDTSDTHKEVREKHSVGIPCIVVDDKVFIVETKEYLKELIEKGIFS